MSIKEMILNFLMHFALIFVTSAIVIWLYNFAMHEAGRFDWDTSFVLSITMGIVFTSLKYQAERSGEPD